MLAVIAPATSGQGVLMDSALGPALDAAGTPEFAPEISAEGRGAIIYHSLTQDGAVLARDFAMWLCLEKKCSRVSDRDSQARSLNFVLSSVKPASSASQRRIRKPFASISRTASSRWCRNNGAFPEGGAS